MPKKNLGTVVTGVVVDETVTFSFTEICQRYTISEDLLFEMMEHGLFERKVIAKKKPAVDVKALRRIEAALRLQRDLGVNMPGVVLALEMRDELEQLRSELDFLRRCLDSE